MLNVKILIRFDPGSTFNSQIRPAHIRSFLTNLESNPIRSADLSVDNGFIRPMKCSTAHCDTGRSPVLRGHTLLPRTEQLVAAVAAVGGAVAARRSGHAVTAGGAGELAR